MRRVLVLAVVGVLAVPAMAASSTQALQRLTDPSFDWSGFFAGLTGAVSTELNGDVVTAGRSGPAIGGVVGANWQSEHYVVGTEAELFWSGPSGLSVCGSVPVAFCNTDLSWMGAWKVRAGVSMNRALIYATGGFSLFGARTMAVNPVPATTGSYDGAFVGWTVGAGVEVAVANTRSIRAEYQFHDLGRRVAPTGTLAADSTSLHPIMHAVRVGISVHF